MLNPRGCTEISLGIFAGANIDMQPTDLPQGLSPDCSDVAFLPGSVHTRPSLKAFSTLGSGQVVVYTSSYLKPDGSTSQLAFTKGGGIYQDGARINPSRTGNLGDIGNFRYLTCNAFGKTYIATSNGTLGVEVPLQLTAEGFLDRVSQDGVGAPPSSVADSASAGQVSPGIHQLVCIFQTRTGYLTSPSPSTSWTAAGGKQVTVSNIPIGPNNVIARIIAFTGANGANFFYLPIPPQLNGAISGTSTVINDNTTTSATFDFSDEALFAGTAIDIPGNNLFSLQVLGPCLGFFYYASRLFAWGERNKVQNFINMSFDGGAYPSAPTLPLGWTVNNPGDGSIGPSTFGDTWTSTTTTISQSAYQDRFGIPILQPNTQYTYRAWVKGSSTATLSSASTGYFSFAIITNNLSGAFDQQNFNLKTPNIIPSDLVLTIVPNGQTIVDELEIIYTLNPYLLTAKVSYVNNSESFDGVTGILGPAGDPHPVLGMEERKDLLCVLTEGPHGSLYETQDTPSGEPATWTVRHIASECGLISAWGTTKFEDWFAWASDTGLRMFDGSNVEKTSQEVQPWWNSIDTGSKNLTVLANDPYTRRLYVIAVNSVATFGRYSVYVMDYRDLNTASLMANAGTLHVGYTGKVVTTDLTRKWSPWTMNVNYAGLITVNGASFMAFCGDLNQNQTSSGGNIYRLNEGVIDGIDDFFGPFWQNSTYPTYFFISAEEAEQKQLGVHRLQHMFMSLNCEGVGSVFVIPNLDRMNNPGKPTRALAVTADLARDLEFGLNLAAERISYRVCCQPAGPQPAPATAPAGFKLSSMTVAVKPHGFSPIRGKNR